MSDMKQLCIDISNAAIALFDELDEKGVEAPLEDMSALLKVKFLIDKTDDMRHYYMRRSASRLIALGVNPETLFKMQQRG